MSAVHMIIHVRDGAAEPLFPGDAVILDYAGDSEFCDMVDYRGNRDLADWRGYGSDEEKHPPIPDDAGLWVLEGTYTETSETDYTAAVEGAWRRPTAAELRRLVDGIPVWGEEEP